METFGERLKAERHRLNLTQERMAEVGGVRKNTQCLYESGGNVPDAEYLQRLADIGLDIIFLFYGERTRIALGPTEQALFAMYESYSPSVRAMLFACISMLHHTFQAHSAGVDEAKMMQAAQFVKTFLAMVDEPKPKLIAKVRKPRVARPRPPSSE